LSYRHLIGTLYSTARPHRGSTLAAGPMWRSCPIQQFPRLKSTPGQHLAFQIVCPKWDMEMQGAASNDGRTIDGNYPAYADGVGKFAMTKR
jgi:hypothetical protein